MRSLGFRLQRRTQKITTTSSWWFVLKKAALYATSIVVMLGCALKLQADEGGAKIIAINQSNANTALIEIGNTFERMIIFPSDITKYVLVERVEGTLNIDQALKQLLDGTGLSALETEDGVIVIKASSDLVKRIEEEKLRNLNLKQKMLATASTAALAVTPNAAAQDIDVAEVEKLSFEEITITAQKRSQNLQDVGIAIAAMSGDQLDRLGVKAASDLAEFIPNVELFDSGDGAQKIVVIRGVGLQDYNANNTPTTAMVVDDVYLPSNVMTPFAMFDMERVEVLKGPQGGLYGRNSTAGVFSFVSKKPEMGVTEGNISLEAGNHGAWGIRGGVSLPLGDTLAVRLAVQHDKSDGYYENTFLDRNVGGANRTYLKGTLSFEPSAAFRADLRLTYGRDKSEAGIPEVVGFYDPNASLTTDPLAPLFGVGAEFFDVPLAADLDAGGFFPVPCPSVVATGIPGPECINIVRHSGDGDPYRGVDDTAFEYDDTYKSAALTLQYDAEAVSIVSIISINQLDYDHPNNDGMTGPNFDATGLFIGENTGIIWNAGYVSDIEAFSQELRLISNNDGPFNWLLGAAYHEDDFSERRRTVIDGNVWWNAQEFPTGGLLTYDQKSEAWSGYGQLSYEINDKWTAIADLRYTSEKKQYSGTSGLADGAFICSALLGVSVDDPFCTLDEFGAFPIPVVSALLGGEEPTADLFPPFTSAYDENDISWKVNVNYKLDRGGIVYFSLGESFKSGGFFGGYLTSPDAVQPYSPEKNMAYEIGLKTSLLDGAVRFDGAVFLYDYKDWQANLTILDSAGTAFSGLTNLGDTETIGAEANIQWLPAPGWELQLGAGFLDSKVKSVNIPAITAGDVVGVGVTDNLNNILDVDGNELPNSPTFSLNGSIQYETHVNNAWLAIANINGNYQSSHYLEVTNTPYDRESSRARVNGRLEFLNEDTGLSVALWAKNLFNVAHRSSTWFDGLNNAWEEYSAPRTYGLTVTYRFGQ